MIQIWRLMKPELSHAKVAYGLIFLLMFVFYTAVSLSGHEAINFVLFFSHTTFLVLFTRGTNVLIALPVTMATIGVVRVSAQTGAILVALVGSSLAASSFLQRPLDSIGGTSLDLPARRHRHITPMDLVRLGLREPEFQATHHRRQNMVCMLWPGHTRPCFLEN